MENSKFVINEKTNKYSLNDEASENDIIEFAKHLSLSKLEKGKVIEGSKDVASYLQSILSGQEYETFGVIFLKSNHEIIRTDIDFFRGTIDKTSVYPREIAKEAFKCNAQSLVFFHNHPSGEHEPSNADIQITDRLVNALDLIEVTVLDHFIVGASKTISFKEKGFL